MAKKKRSQRRKNKISEDGTSSASGMTEDTIAILPDDHTIADSISTLQSLHDEFQDKDEENGNFDHDISQATARHGKVVDALNSLSDIMCEKRSSRREQCLRAFFKALTQYACTNTSKELVAFKTDEVIIPAALFSLRNSSTNSSPAEQYAACRCLEATSILLGYGNDDYMESIDAPLRKVVKATGMAIQVRLAALRALSLSYFMCGTDIEEVYQCMDFCELVCAEKFRGEHVHELLRASAVECWTLLATVISDVELAGDGYSSQSNGSYVVYDDEDDNENEDEEYEGKENGNCKDGDNFNDDAGRGVKMLHLFQKCLEESHCIELKNACGEAVALVHEARLDLGLGDDQDATATQKKFERGSWDGSDHEVIIDELKQVVSELALTTGHHMSKKAKKEQRATFREIQCTLVDDEPPCDCINIGSTTLDLNSWKEVIQLNFIRHCLQSGFQTQFMTNETLWKIFGLDGRDIMANQGIPGSGMTQFEKRMTMGKTSEAAKAADRHLVKKRRNRNQAKHSFLTADGDDI